jgi:hypothetical protein
MSPGRWGTAGEGWGRAGRPAQDRSACSDNRNGRKAWTAARLEFTNRRSSNPFSRSIRNPSGNRGVSISWSFWRPPRPLEARKCSESLAAAQRVEELFSVRGTRWNAAGSGPTGRASPACLLVDPLRAAVAAPQLSRITSPAQPRGPPRRLLADLAAKKCLNLGVRPLLATVSASPRIRL